MKKILAFALCICVLMGCTACAAKEDAALSAPAVPATTATPTATPEPTPALTPTPTPAPAPTPAPLSTAYYEGDYSGYEPIIPSAAKASSSLEFSGKVYSADYAADGDLDSCWQEAAEGSGVGESLVLEYGSPVSISLLRFRMGFAKNDKLFYMNGRPARVLVEFSDGRSVVCDFPDENRWFTLELSEPVELDWLRLSLLEVYDGEDCQDTCISEIRAYGSCPGAPAETEYSGGLVPSTPNYLVGTTQTDSNGYKQPYAAYIELLETNRWATDFGIDLEDNPSLEGQTLQEYWNMSWEDYLVTLPVQYAVFDTNGDGVDELMVCGDCTIGIIDHCYFFTWNGSDVVYMGKVVMRPDCVYKDGDGFILCYSVSMSCSELGIRFENGSPIEGEWVRYSTEDNRWPSDRGLELVAVCHERNDYPFPYLEPLIELAQQ